MEQNTQNNKQQINNKKSESEVGCIWEKINDKGYEYLSIKLEIDGQIHFLKGFLNSRYKNEKQPKFILYKSKDNSNKQRSENFQNKSDAELQDKEYQRLLNQDKSLRNKKLD